MPISGDGRFPIITSWGRKPRGRGNTSILVKQSEPSEIRAAVFKDYLYGQSAAGINESFTETLAASDALAVARTTIPAYTESLAATDTNAAQNTLLTTTSDSVAASDDATASFLYTAAFTDTVTGSDTNSAAYTANATTTDGLTGTDSLGAALQISTLTTETIAANDGLGGTLDIQTSFADSAALADSLDAQAAYNPVLSESVTADFTESDSQSGGGTIYNDTIEEPLTAEDGLSLQFIEGDVRGTPSFNWVVPKKQKEEIQQIQAELASIDIAPKVISGALELMRETAELQQLIQRKNELEARLFALTAQRRRNNQAMTALVLASPFNRIAA